MRRTTRLRGGYRSALARSMLEAGDGGITQKEDAVSVAAGRAQTDELTRQPRVSWRVDAVTMLLGTWLLVGLVVDGWAHNNLQALETFFTPWHALFYSGFLATAGWTLAVAARGHQPGRPGLEGRAPSKSPFVPFVRGPRHQPASHGGVDPRLEGRFRRQGYSDICRIPRL